MSKESKRLRRLSEIYPRMVIMLCAGTRADHAAKLFWAAVLRRAGRKHAARCYIRDAYNLRTGRMIGGMRDGLALLRDCER